MTFQEYQAEAGKTAVYPGSGYTTGLMYASLGLAGEAGELANQVKKCWRDGEIYAGKEEGMKKEIGDVLWYVAAVATELGVSLDTAAHANVEKLRSRAQRGVLGGSGDDR